MRIARDPRWQELKEFADSTSVDAIKRYLEFRGNPGTMTSGQLAHSHVRPQVTEVEALFGLDTVSGTEPP